MRRISTSTKVADKFGAGKHGFTNGDAVAGIPATDLEDQFFDHLQEELAAIVEAAGGAVDGSSRSQVYQALVKLFGEYTAAGEGAVERTISARLDDLIDAANYITAPGASDAADQLGVQKAIDAAAARGGGFVRVRKPIRNTWDLSLLVIPAGVLILDERYIDSGHESVYGSGTDVERRVHGKSVSGGEGPAFVGVNTATSGDRTVTFCGRWGDGAGSNVIAITHYGVMDTGVWYPEVDIITSGDDGFRSTLRAGHGTVQVNAGIPGAVAYGQNKIMIVNKPVPLGSGPLWEVGTTVTKAFTELHVAAANAPVRLCAVDGTPEWSFLSQFPSAGQLTIWDSNTNSAKLSFTSAGDTVHSGVLKYSADNTWSLFTASNRPTVIFAMSGTINTSDQREKSEFVTIPEAVLDAWGEVREKIGVFQWLASVAEKGESARLHFGIPAQAVDEAFSRHGVEARRWGLFCEDEIKRTVPVKKTVVRQLTELVDVQVEKFVRDGDRLVRKISTEEEERPMTKQVPIFNEDETPVMKTVFRVVTDENGNTVLDEFGRPVIVPEALQATGAVPVYGDVEIEVLEEQSTGETRLGLRFDQCMWLDMAWTRRELRRLSVG